MTTSSSSSRPWPGAVLFDLDGTLVDSVADITAAVNELLLSRNLPPQGIDQVRLMIGEGVGKLVERAFAAAGAPLPEADLEETEHVFMPIYCRHLTRYAKLMPGAAEAVSQLHIRGIRLGLVTNKPQIAAREIMLHFHLAERFDVIVGGDTVSRKKPAPDALLFALERLGVPPGETLMVGDSLTDLTAARAAGMPVVLTRGGYSRQPVDTLGADMVCDSLLDLPNIVQWMNSAGLIAESRHGRSDFQRRDRM